LLKLGARINGCIKSRGIKEDRGCLASSLENMNDPKDPEEVKGF